nr:hypothetical protein [Tanacetum cinerariifolium]
MSTPTFAKTHNLIVYLEKPTKSKGFAQIINFVNGSSVKYALTASPTIYTSCIKQFWTSAKVKPVNVEVRIQALVDGKRVNIKESSIRCTLRLDDAEGTSCLTNIVIFEGLAKMGAKTTSWNKFSSTMASAIICLATNQKFSFSRYILYSLVKNIEAGVLFFMFPRFVQLMIIHQLGDMAHHKEIFDTPSFTKKVFANMKRVGTGFFRELTPLFDNMLVQAPEEVVLELESEVIDRKSTYQERIEKLEGRVERLEEENMVFKELKSVHSTDDADEPAYNLDLNHQEKVLSMIGVNEEEPTDVEEVLEVVKTAKLMTKVVTTARATKVSIPRKRRGFIIQDPEEITTIATVQPKEKDVEVESSKREGESLEQEIIKKQKLEEETEELKKHLQIVTDDDDDVYTDATPLASKISIVDYKIHTERNRPYFKIIRADGNHMLFISFSTMLKNFDREDIESLWKL